jgi:hypothetical protein
MRKIDCKQKVAGGRSTVADKHTSPLRLARLFHGSKCCERYSHLLQNKFTPPDVNWN